MNLEPIEAFERFNHLLATGDGNPFRQLLDPIHKYSCAILGTEAIIEGVEAKKMSMDDCENFSIKRKRASVDVIDAIVEGNRGFWFVKFSDLTQKKDGYGSIYIVTTESGISSFIFIS